MKTESIIKDKEFYNIIKPYYEDKHIKTLENIPHHKSSNRLEHSLNVSYKAYKIAKKYKLNYKSVAKAGLLHDMYFNRINDMKTTEDKIKLLTNDHPKAAVNNAKKYFEINKLEEDIILTHMWPMSKYVPKYKESLIVGFADKVCTFKDAMFNLNAYKNKLSNSLGVYFILFFLTKF